MATNPLTKAVELLRLTRGQNEDTALPDAQLLADFIERRDEASFAVLVRRHGPLVMGVCQRITRNRHDAEDAFQAVFLVLVRKAASITKRESLANWLYAVAFKAALRIQTAVAKRRSREKQVNEMPEKAINTPNERDDWLLLLDQELTRLPKKYRLPVILCDLEGKKQKQAAQLLGCPENTLATRLARARAMLAKRLTQRGFNLPSATLVAVLAQSTASAKVTPGLVSATVKAASAFATGVGAASGVISIKVIALAEGVLRGMAVGKAKLVLVAALGLVLAAGGVGLVRGKTKVDVTVAAAAAANAVVAQVAEEKPRVDHYGDPLPEGAVARLGAKRFRHEGLTVDLVFTKDGKYLLGNSFSGLTVWDAATGKERLRMSIRIPSKLAVSPDSNVLAIAEPEVATENARVPLFDINKGEKLKSFTLAKGVGRNARVNHIFFTPDGKRLAINTGHDGKAFMFDLASSKSTPFEMDGSQFVSLALSPDGKTVALASSPASPGALTGNFSVQLWSTGTAKLIRRVHERALIGADGYGRALTFSGDGNKLAVGDSRGILLFDLKSGTQPETIETDLGREYDLALSPDGATVLSRYNSEGNIRVWDISSKRLLHTLEGHDATPRTGAMALSPDGKTVAFGNVWNALKLWDVASGMEVYKEYDGHYSQINGLAFSPDGKTLASVGGNGPLCFWNTASWQRTGAQEMQALAFGHSLAYSPQGNKLAVGSMGVDGTANLRIWDASLNKDESISKIPGAGYIISINFSPDGKSLITVDWNKNQQDTYSIKEWDLPSMTRKEPYVVSGAYPAIHLTQTAKWVFSTPNDRAVRVRDLVSGRERIMAGKETERISGAIPSPDARLLASGILGGPLAKTKVWEVATGKELALLQGHDGYTAFTAWSPNARWLATGDRLMNQRDPSKVQSVRLWDMATGKQVAVFDGFQANVSCLAFAPNGKILAVGLQDSTILVWDVEQAVGKPPTAGKFSQKHLESYWQQLGGVEAPEAHGALWALVESPPQAVPFLKDQLKPISLADQGKIQNLITDLDSDKFSTRQAAEKELTKLGEQIQVPIQKALAGNISLETRRRLEQILNNVFTNLSPETLRGIRAIMALERIGSPEAKAVLDTLAKGAPGARETEEAKASLERLALRTAQAR